jgi:hypothetical protein
MPIKPENRHRYPTDWPAIRERILQRAGYQCEHPGCAARQYAFGVWTLNELGWRWHEIEDGHPIALRWNDAKQRAAEAYFARGEEGDRPIVIVLTIAHLDHMPENCAPENLRALCQRHHLAHDHALHMASSQATRRARLAAGELF